MQFGCATTCGEVMRYEGDGEDCCCGCGTWISEGDEVRGKPWEAWGGEFMTMDCHAADCGVPGFYEDEEVAR